MCFYSRDRLEHALDTVEMILNRFVIPLITVLLWLALCVHIKLTTVFGKNYGSIFLEHGVDGLFTYGQPFAMQKMHDNPGFTKHYTNYCITRVYTGYPYLDVIMSSSGVCG